MDKLDELEKEFIKVENMYKNMFGNSDEWYYKIYPYLNNSNNSKVDEPDLGK